MMRCVRLGMMFHMRGNAEWFPVPAEKFAGTQGCEPKGLP